MYFYIILFRYMICKHFFPFNRFPFHFIDHFFWWAKAFSLMKSFVFLFSLVFKRYIQKKIKAKTSIKKLTVFFQEFYHFRSYILLLILHSFLKVYESNFILCLWLSNFPNTNYQTVLSPLHILAFSVIYHLIMYAQDYF